MPLSSPALDDYNQTGIVGPPLQRALDLIRQRMAPALTANIGTPAGPPASTPATGGMTPRLLPSSAPQVPNLTGPLITPAPSPSAPAAAAPVTTPQPSPAAVGHQQELDRVSAAPLPEMIPRLSATGAFERMQPNAMAHTKADTGRSGTEQIHNPWVRRPLEVLNALGNTFLPALTMSLPGTEYHHQMLVNQAAGNVNRDETAATAEANREHLGAEAGELGARAQHETAEAAALANPKDQLEWQQGTEPEIDPAHPELGPQAVWYNKADPTKKHFGGASVAAKPIAEKNEPHYEKTEDGSIIALTKDATGKPVYSVVYHGDPKVPKR